MSKVSVLHIVGNLNRGGAETFLVNLLHAINEQKFEFIFLVYGDDTYDYEQEVVSAGARVVRIKTPYSFIEMYKLMRRMDVDVVHTHVYFSSAFSLLISRLAGVRERIAHSHSVNLELQVNPIRALYGKISKTIIRTCSTQRLACSNDAGRALYDNKDFTVIHNGIPLSTFSFNEKSREEIRDSLNISDDVMVVGHVGRLDRVKNHSFLLQVFKRYHDVNKKSVLLLVGDGPLRGEILNDIRELCLLDSVIMLGKRDDTCKIYSAFDVFIFPSLCEGLGMVLIEAQANGLPSLATSTIPKEVALTPLVSFVGLEDGAQAWADACAAVTRTRGKNPDFMYESLNTYDVNTVAKKMECIYRHEDKRL